MKRAIVVGLGYAFALGCASTYGAVDVPATIEAGIDATADAEPDDAFVPIADPDGSLGADAPVISKVGCSDGTREAFVGSGVAIAGCEGAWTVPGLLVNTPPQCGRASGNTGTNSSGLGCSAADLCAFGWHLCTSAADVASHGGALAGGICTVALASGKSFFGTAQPSTGAANCDLSGIGTNDVFGCGDTGTAPGADCTPLNATISTTSSPPGFSFGAGLSSERLEVLKAAGPGGVLCCAD